MLQITDAESAKNTNSIFKKNKYKVCLKAILILWKYSKYSERQGGAEGKVSYL